MCLVGAGLFATGFILSINPLIATGIALIVVAIMGLLVDYIFCKKEAVRVHNPIAYSTNNMNTMKRNKSDTDLELINRQSEEAEANIV
jgi:hypothetical protein